MAQLRLGAIGLTPKDVAYLRALVRLYANTDKLAWTYTEQPPYEAVVVDRTGRDANPAWFDAFDGLVLTLVEPPAAPDEDTVAYPVNAEQFRTWLKLHQYGRQAVAEPALAMVAAAETADETAGESARTEEPAAAARPGQRRFKLRRWPAPAVLAGNELHLKIATLMVRKIADVEKAIQL